MRRCAIEAGIIGAHTIYINDLGALNCERWTTMNAQAETVEFCEFDNTYSPESLELRV